MTDDGHNAAGLLPSHVRAARALLAWSQRDLASAANVATSTIVDFERGKRTPVAENRRRIRVALVDAGIRLLPGGAEFSGATDMAPRERPSTPVRWVDAGDLTAWADQVDSAFDLSTLIAHLIQGTHPIALRLRFPAGEGVRHAGWDGVTQTETGSVWVPAGRAGWEISTQRTGIPQKAMKDYEKRTEQPGVLDPANAVFVFVTLRHWPDKDTWALARQDEGPWRGVRVYDADDLVHWIEQAPAVGLWLATRLGKRPPGVRELDNLWEEWSLATRWPLTEKLVLSDRDQESADVLRWLGGEPSVFSLRSTTTEEVAAFFHATLRMLPDDMVAFYQARCLVATTSTSARALANAPAGLILLMPEPEAGLAQLLVNRGHFVLLAYDERPRFTGEIRSLTRPSRQGIASALTAAGFPQPRAEALARDSARNLTVLRRLVPGAPDRLPVWAREVPPRALLAALLAGGWDDSFDADQARLAEIADEPYDAVVRTLACYTGDFDSPLQKVGSSWRVASPMDAWMLLASHLNSVDIDRFEAAAYSVLGSADPRYEMDPNERWMAALKGVHPEYSDTLRHGIGHVLILLALWGGKVRMVSDATRRADTIVQRLLSSADSQRWWSLSGDFRLLAEASPGSFLTALEEALDQDDPPIRALFDEDEGSVLGAEYLSDLLWALESLAWSPGLMGRISLVLARLDEIDNTHRRFMNRPANSLREIHLLWGPQTFASLDKRLRAIDLVRTRESHAAWKLMLAVMTRDGGMSTPSPLPIWRDFSVGELETVTLEVVRRGAAAITERLLMDAGVSAERWTQLLERFPDLTPDIDAGIAALSTAERMITGSAERALLRDGLRRLLHHHRRFQDAVWCMPVDVLDRLESIYDRLEPADPIERVAWLFEHAVVLPRPPADGWKLEEQDIDVARQDATVDIHSRGGAASILALARRVPMASYIGRALVHGGMEKADLNTVLEASLRSENEHERQVGHGLIVSSVRNLPADWGGSLIAKAQDEIWGDTALLAILLALPGQRSTWDKAAKIGPRIEAKYWTEVPVFWMDESSEDIAFAIQKLRSVGRARDALPLAERSGRKNDLPTRVLVELLFDSTTQPVQRHDRVNGRNMLQYHVVEVLKVLDERSDVGEDTLISLEWACFPLLEYSDRPAKAIQKALSDQPKLFVEVLCAVFRASEDSGIAEAEKENPEQARAVARQVYMLLEKWNVIPGSHEDGSIDTETLEAWIREARQLADAVGRGRAADSRIGHLLSAAPAGADGHWPTETVRNMLELFRSKPMLEGFHVGKWNRRGITTRNPQEGGDLERLKAMNYRNWAAAMDDTHPSTAEVLNGLAESYEKEARRLDDDAARLQW